MMSTIVNTPAELEALSIGTVIDDSGLEAVKTESGTWLYTSHDFGPLGQYWEPGFPAKTKD